jgi:hypothetical protein
MNKIEEIVKLLEDHFSSNADVNDREALVKVRELSKEYLDENKVKSEDATEQASPSNIYQVLMARMNPEQLATLGVQLIQVNGAELFWMTSVGQLYAFNNKQAALEAEYAWLMSKPN